MVEHLDHLDLVLELLLDLVERPLMTVEALDLGLVDVIDHLLEVLDVLDLLVEVLDHPVEVRVALELVDWMESRISDRIDHHFDDPME